MRSAKSSTRLRHFGLLLFLLGSPLCAQSLSYPDPCLDYVHPAGARQGQTLTVEFGGTNGFTGASQILVEGPGIAVSDVKSVNAGLVTATFTVAPGAAPGRRIVRVLGGNNPLTNGRSFFVGKLPEVLEVEPKGTVPPQEVSLPVVVNGRINPTLDVDEFRFAGKAGQKLVAAVAAHRLDSIAKRIKSPGYLDTSLELLDASGNILATDEDTFGVDPLVFVTLPEDGQYTVRLKSLSFQGTPESVYRLTLGEVPYPTVISPRAAVAGRPLKSSSSAPTSPRGLSRPSLPRSMTHSRSQMSRWLALATASSGSPLPGTISRRRAKSNRMMNELPCLWRQCRQF